MKALLPLLAVALLSAGCADPCANTEVARAASPDRATEAVLFERNCGATTDFSTQISLVKPGAALKGAGTVFIADGNRGAAPAAPWRGPWAEASWQADGSLLVRYDARARVFQQKSEVGGVRITYQPVTP